jgi:hypothetical protein
LRQPVEAVVEIGGTVSVAVEQVAQLSVEVPIVKLAERPITGAFRAVSVRIA